MKAMILAAGRGERMKPLTDSCPKPLLSLGNDLLITRHLKQLKKSGITEIVINHAWLGQQIENTLLDGQQYGVSIQYSPEGKQGLETAGGIANAKHLLGNNPFLVINSDILTDFNFSAAINAADQILYTQYLAHLWLVPNPAHNLKGDYSINHKGELSTKNNNHYTFSGIAVYKPELFDAIKPGTQYKLATLFNDYLSQHSLRAQVYHGLWLDVGTPERLTIAQQLVKNEA